MGAGIAMAVCSLLVAAPWFWPLLIGPDSAMWPNLSAWTAGALLIALLPQTGERAGRAIARGWLLAALGSALLGLLQYFDLENGLFPWVAPTVPGYVIANVHQPNMLASLLAVGLLSIWWLLVQKRLTVFHAVWMGGLLIVALAATASRTGMLHLIAISALVLYWHPRHWQRLLIVLTLAWAVYLVSADALAWIAWEARGIAVDRNLLSRLAGEAGCQSRRILWGNMLELIAQKPWTGWGPGELMYAHFITDYEGPRFCDKLSNAHNFPLHLAVVFGIPVAVSLCALLAYAVVRLQPWKAVESGERFFWGVLALLGLHSLLEFPLWFGVFQLMALLAVWQIYRARSAGQKGEGIGQLTRARLALSGALLAGLGFVAWDYHKVSQIYLPDSRRMASYKEDTFNKSRETILFREHALIAQVVGTDLTPENAEPMLQAALASLHIAPDSRIIRRVIESAALSGKAEMVQFYAARYKAAWPKQYQEWIQLQQAAERQSADAEPAPATK